MPANLTPQYYEAERVYKEAKTSQEKIDALEAMLGIMPKHKGTDKLKADLRKKISQLKKEMTKKHGSKKGVSYDIRKEGAGQIILTGMPNSGKSTIVDLLTNAATEIAPYPFTTREAIPGMMKYENIQIQLIDIPPFTDEFAETWLNNILRNSDALAIILDLSTDPLKELEESLKKIEYYKIQPIDKIEDYKSDPIIIPKKLLIIGNKIDLEDSEIGKELVEEEIKNKFPFICISGKEEINIDGGKKEFFNVLDIVRVYSKAPGQKVNYDAPFIMKKGSNLLDFATRVHKEFRDQLKYARIWGGSAEKFDGQRVDRDYILEDKVVLELKV